MKTRILLCARLLTIGTTIVLNSNRVIAKSLTQSDRSVPRNAIVSEINTKAKAYVLSGRAKFDRQDYSGAFGDYNRAIVIDPNYAAAYQGRALVERKLGLEDRAIEDYKRVIEIAPNDTNAYKTLSNALVESGNNSEAIRYLNRAIEINPNDPDAYNNRGVVKNQLGDNSGAIADFNRALKINPKNSTAIRNIAAINEAMNEAARRAEQQRVLEHINRVNNARRAGWK